MAKLKPLANITTMRDIRAYAAAESADAARQCPAAAGDYQKATQILDTYATFEGTPLEITYVELARQAILEARKTWYAVGCKAPDQASPEPSNDGGDGGGDGGGLPPVVVPGSSLIKVIVAGGLLLGALAYFSKQKKAGKPGATRRRRIRRTARGVRIGRRINV